MPLDNPAINDLEIPALKRNTRWIRLAMALVGAVLLGDAVALMGMGLFNVGITLPACIGHRVPAACIVLGRRGAMAEG